MALDVDFSIKGGKLICPFCGNPYSLPQSKGVADKEGLWRHISTKHRAQRLGLYPAYTAFVLPILARRKKAMAQAIEDQKTAELDRQREHVEKMARSYTLTGEEISHIRIILSITAGMMEPYYLQNGGRDDADQLGAKLGELLNGQDGLGNLENSNA